ncbi:MAG TPA: VOC family protein [Mycobacteriales bacterium]|jgi:methylmalonyl-CoA/ethylmalonyl-CoA epimerase|nr:VOC family protein [Mycobacteriales bacterium]
MKVSGLHHIGYVVPRMGPALSRFLDEGATVLVEPVDDPVQKVTVALLRADGDVPIELVAPTPGLDSPVVARLRRGGGFDHLCYSIPDVGGALAEESGRGSLIVCEPVFAVAFSRTIGFVQRRSGMVVEYISDEETSAP